MHLFTKTPQEMGVQLYEALRRELEPPGVLSVERLCNDLIEGGAIPHDQSTGEAMIGCLFAAVIAIESSAWRAHAAAIRTGAEAEFLRHLAEQGATAAQVEEWEAVMRDRFAEFFQCLDADASGALPESLGESLVLHLTGADDVTPYAALRATQYLTSARAKVRFLLDKAPPYGGSSR
jgi:hypothetical protein